MAERLPPHALSGTTRDAAKGGSAKAAASFGCGSSGRVAVDRYALLPRAPAARYLDVERARVVLVSRSGSDDRDATFAPAWVLRGGHDAAERTLDVTL